MKWIILCLAATALVLAASNEWVRHNADHLGPEPPLPPRRPLPIAESPQPGDQPAIGPPAPSGPRVSRSPTRPGVYECLDCLGGRWSHPDPIFLREFVGDRDEVLRSPRYWAIPRPAGPR